MARLRSGGAASSRLPPPPPLGASREMRQIKRIKYSCCAPLGLPIYVAIMLRAARRPASQWPLMQWAPGGQLEEEKRGELSEGQPGALLFSGRLKLLIFCSSSAAGRPASRNAAPKLLSRARPSLARSLTPRVGSLAAQSLIPILATCSPGQAAGSKLQAPSSKLRAPNSRLLQAQASECKLGQLKLRRRYLASARPASSSLRELRRPTFGQLASATFLF